MQQKLRLFISITLIMSGSVQAAANATLPFFSIRSQGTNAAREMVGCHEHINKNHNMRYGAVTITPHYARSIKSDDINNLLFGSDLRDDKTIRVSGIDPSRKREANEWLADYFLLPREFESDITFKPRVTNIMFDISFFISMNHVWKGMYFKMHAPLCHSKWDLNLNEKVNTPGVFPHLRGYLNTGTTNLLRTTMPKDFSTFIKGESVLGDLKTPLQYGKIDGAHTSTRFADIHMALGKNFSFRNGRYNFGFSLQVVAPTGNTPDAKWLFEPVVGNTNHWEVGGGTNMHARLWTSKNEEKHLDIYLDGNITHLMDCVQKRSYDFKNKPNSRYMLLSEFGTPVDQLFGAVTEGDITGAAAPTAQYKKELHHAINITTLDTKVNVAVQGDMAIKLAFSHGALTCNLGYNLWGRSKEKLTPQETIQANRYGIKGDAMIAGFGAADAATATLQNLIFALSATQSGATINAGTNSPSGQLFDVGVDYRNPNIDNPQFAFTSVPGATVPASADDEIVRILGVNQSTGDQQRTSINPILIKQSDLDLEDRPSALSHKVFGHINYTWKETKDEKWKTFLGLGFELEYASKQNKVHTTLSQWGVWAKGGIAFH